MKACELEDTFEFTSTVTYAAPSPAPLGTSTTILVLEVDTIFETTIVPNFTTTRLVSEIAKLPPAIVT